MKTLHTVLPEGHYLSSKVAGTTPICSLTQSASEVRPGSLFFAIRGTRADGHAFAKEAVARGAIAVVEDTTLHSSLPSVLVNSTRQALGEAAARWYGDPLIALPLVGITGTNGKTTCAFLLAGIWEASGFKSGLVGTVEYRIGSQVEQAPLTTPDALTLQQLFARMRDNGVARAAMEVSSIALDQKRVAGCRFEVAVFTNFTPDHLDYHGSMDSYAQAKEKLFTDYEVGTAVLNADDPLSAQWRRSTRAKKILTYSTQSEDSDFVALQNTFDADGIRAKVKCPQGIIELRSPLLGSHNLANCLAVLAAQHALGLSIEEAVRVLSHHPGAPGRLERIASGGNRPYVFVDYAHTEDALKNVLQSLHAVRGDSAGRILTVFGCGGDRDRSKRPRMGAAAALLSDIVIATSDNPRTENPDSILDEIEQGFPPNTLKHRRADRRQAITLALELARPGDFVLVAGKGHETYQILGDQKVPFDDRQVIRDYYGV